MALRQGHGQNGTPQPLYPPKPEILAGLGRVIAAQTECFDVSGGVNRLSAALTRVDSTATANAAQATGSARISSASRSVGFTVVTATIDGVPRVVSRRVRRRCNECKEDGCHRSEAVMQATDPLDVRRSCQPKVVGYGCRRVTSASSARLTAKTEREQGNERIER